MAIFIILKFLGLEGISSRIVLLNLIVTYSANSLSSYINKSEAQAVLGRQHLKPTPWLTERHGYAPTYFYQT